MPGRRKGHGKRDATMRKLITWAACAAMLAMTPLAVPAPASADSFSVTIGNGDGPRYNRHGPRYRDGYRYRDNRRYGFRHRVDNCRVVNKRKVVFRNGHRVVIRQQVRSCS